MHNQLANVAIPDDLNFSDLRLARDPDGSVSMDWAVIERICQASNLPTEIFRDAPEDNIARLIVTWYTHHRAAGGDPDPTAEDLLAEVNTEDKLGSGISFQPGRA